MIAEAELDLLLGTDGAHRPHIPIFAMKAGDL